MKVLTILIIFVSFTSSCSNQERNEHFADYKLTKEFGVDSANLKYQFYQKYGFTDVCEEIHIVYAPESSPEFANSLPIKNEDLKKLKPNFNQINDSTISLKRNSRYLYADIELGFSEYFPDTNLSLQINNGNYEISESEFETTLQIFDEESGLVYLGVKRCDGR